MVFINFIGMHIHVVHLLKHKADNFRFSNVLRLIKSYFKMMFVCRGDILLVQKYSMKKT